MAFMLTGRAGRLLTSGVEVGFTGSGQSMRKDAARTRHIYQQAGEDEQY